MAARIVEMTKSQFGADEPEMANSLTNLATTYYRMKEYGEALDNYRAANKKSHQVIKPMAFVAFCRGEMIRTSDLHVPNVMR